MNEDRRLYSAPRLIEFGRIEELTLGHGGGHKSIGLSERWPWEAQFDRALARLRALPLPA